MILNALRIANFKAFGPSQSVPLRPITLLYGANSAGKSSVLHALALAHHAVETGELDVQQTRIGGDAIDLGGFRQYVHRRQPEAQMELTFALEAKRLSGRAGELLKAARDVVVQLGIGGGPSDGRERERGVRVERFTVEVDGRPMLAMSARREGVLRLDRLDHGHPIFRDVFRGILTVATTTADLTEEDFAGVADVMDEVVPGITGRREGLFPRIEHEAGDEVERYSGLVAVSRGRRQEDLAHAARLFLPRVLRDIVGGLATAVEVAIRRLGYLGPLRSYPPRHIAFSQHHDPNWRAGGGYAWEVVRRHADVRKRVNRWLGDPERLKTPYELQTRDFLPAGKLAADLAERLDDELINYTEDLLGALADAEEAPELAAAAEAVRTADTDESEAAEEPPDAIAECVDAFVDVEEVSQEWVRDLAKGRSDTLQDLVLVDKRSGTVVSHRDVGIGVSQVLPVLVSAYASTSKLLAIEQPEIHLHPGLQAELGDVFIESALGGADNRFLIETHSEHLLLRIMRRMRQTAAGELPNGVPAVHPENVMVLFVEPDGARSLVREMPLNERGELVKAWPGGFFEEGMREIF